VAGCRVLKIRSTATVTLAADVQAGVASYARLQGRASANAMTIGGQLQSGVELILVTTIVGA